MDGNLENGPFTKYVVLEELGRDRLGRVYRALSSGGDVVALRVLHVGGMVARERAGVARDWLRSRILEAARARHPALARVLEVGAEGPVDWMATELVGGRTLQALLDAGETLTFVRAIRIAITVADAVNAAHVAGITHGRLSASNIRVGPKFVKVVDLGVPRSDELALRVGEMNPDHQFDTERRCDVLALCQLTMLLLDAAQGGDAEATARGHALRVAVDEACHIVSGRADADARAVHDALITAVRQVYAGPQPRLAETAPVAALNGTASENEEEALRAEYVFLPDEEPWQATVGKRVARLVPHVAGSIALLGAAAVALASASVVERGRNADESEAWYKPEVIQAAPVQRVTPVSFVSTRTPQPLRSDSIGARLVVATAEPAKEESPPVAVKDSTAKQPADSAAKPRRGVKEPRKPKPVRQPIIETAAVLAHPIGSLIQRGDDYTIIGVDSVDVSIERGDSLVLLFRRAGYVPEKRIFTGEPLSVHMRPDSVYVSFFSNIQAEVYLEDGNGGRLFGKTDLLKVRVPTGSHRFRLRAPNLPDWTIDREMLIPGERYQVTKLDFPTRGKLVVNVASSCAMVSLDGGPARRMPATFDDLPPTQHIIRVRYADGAAVTDTVQIEAGRTTARSYGPRATVPTCST
jgi:hypothetical protein